MNGWNDLELLELKLIIALERTEVNEEGVVIEKRYLIHKIGNVKIEIYPIEHPPPHFHIKSPDLDATFRITDCELLTGTVDSKTLKKIKYFHKLSKIQLIEVWNNLRPTDCPVGPIEIEI